MISLLNLLSVMSASWSMFIHCSIACLTELNLRCVYMYRIAISLYLYLHIFIPLPTIEGRKHCFRVVCPLSIHPYVVCSVKLTPILHDVISLYLLDGLQQTCHRYNTKYNPHIKGKGRAEMNHLISKYFRHKLQKKNTSF